MPAFSPDTSLTRKPQALAAATAAIFMVALAANVSTPSCIVAASGLYLLCACVRFFA